MGCCNALPPPNLVCSDNLFFDKTQTMWLKLDDKIERKAIKLLARQYEIESIRQEPKWGHDQVVVKESPMIVTYFDRTNPRQKFEWKLKKVIRL